MRISIFTMLMSSMMYFHPSTSIATTMLHVTDIQQAKTSDAVVIATIGSAITSPHPNKKSIMTETNILIEEVLAGDAPTFIKIRQMGGTQNEKTMYVPGDARLVEGTKVLLFLNEEAGVWYLTAMEQSKYDLSLHPKLGWTMTRELHGGMVVRTSQGKLVPFKPQKEKPVQRLSDFRVKLKKGGVQ